MMGQPTECPRSDPVANAEAHTVLRAARPSRTEIDIAPQKEKLEETQPTNSKAILQSTIITYIK